MKPSSLKKRNGGSSSLARITQAANQSGEPPKRNVADVLMSTAPSTPSPTNRNPSGSPASKKTRGDMTPSPAPPRSHYVSPATPPPSRTQRTNVGFSETRTEISESVQDDGSTYASVAQRMAPVFASSNTRAHSMFMRVKLPIPDHGQRHNTDATKESREFLKRFMETMIQIDPTAIVYKWRQTSPEEKDACLLPTQLPTTITGLQSYMSGFRPKPEGGAMWGSLRIGFNSDAADFFANLEEEGRMHDFWSKLSPLQTADTEYAGFLYLSLESMHPEAFSHLVNAWIIRTAPLLKKKPITIAFEYRAIWDDGPKSNTLPPKERRAKKALHVICATGFADSAHLWVRTFLRSKTYRQFYKVPMHFVPQFRRGQGETYNRKHQKSVRKHMKITTFGVKLAKTVDLRDIDDPCDLLDGSPTGRQLIMGLTLDSPGPPIEPGGPPTPLPVFLSIDRSQRKGERGTYVVTFTQSNAVEAEEKLRHLLSYLEHHYESSHVSHWFTQDACERAEEVIWDDETNRPISRAERDLDELLDEDIDWLDDLDDAKLHFEAATITVERPKRFQHVQSNPLEGDAESTPNILPRFRSTRNGRGKRGSQPYDRNLQVRWGLSRVFGDWGRVDDETPAPDPRGLALRTRGTTDSDSVTPDNQSQHATTGVTLPRTSGRDN